MLFHFPLNGKDMPSLYERFRVIMICPICASEETRFSISCDGGYEESGVLMEINARLSCLDCGYIGNPNGSSVDFLKRLQATALRFGARVHELIKSRRA